MPAFALYRLPYSRQCRLVIQTKGEPEELPSVSALSGKEGFVMAPFAVDTKHPVLLFHPDADHILEPDDLARPEGLPTTVAELLHRMLNDNMEGKPARQGTFAHYAIDFANFHAHIMEGDFSKIVLARCCVEENPQRLSPLQLYAKACHEYPRLFVALVSAKRCGTWLMSTPEMLLEGGQQRWSTMSLAGTMALTQEQMDFDEPPSPHRQEMGSITWGRKNIQEQRFVSTYITECLEQVASDIEEKGPYTVRAGKLVHLRSDFFFTLPTTQRIGDLLSALYPTPAVCGLPKDAARDFIVRNEHSPRGYYSGFTGMLCPDAETHLFVSLRCMRMRRQVCSLYAGGGLLADSDLNTEWRETEDKMDTMRLLLK